MNSSACGTAVSRYGFETSSGFGSEGDRVMQVSLPTFPAA